MSGAADLPAVDADQLHDKPASTAAQVAQTALGDAVLIALRPLSPTKRRGDHP